jgi:hypothetical protein
MGVSVGAAGDVNADGYDDLIVGATDGNGASTEVGEAHVFSGKDGSLLYTFLAQEGGTSFGSSVSGAGDMDADGYADLVVGARYDDTAAIFAGAVYVYSGRTGNLLHAFYGDAEGDRMGTEVSGAVGSQTASRGFEFRRAHRVLHFTLAPWTAGTRRHGDTRGRWLGDS